MLLSTRSAPEAAFELWSRIFGRSPLIDSRSLRSLVDVLGGLFGAARRPRPDEPGALGFDLLQPRRGGGQALLDPGQLGELLRQLLTLGERGVSLLLRAPQVGTEPGCAHGKKARERGGGENGDQQQNGHGFPS